jgi:nitrogen fixation/metabolism regulation signal transduction histidine kinase
MLVLLRRRGLDERDLAEYRRTDISVDSAAKAIVISNNGAKIQPNIRRTLFRFTFVTTKLKGRGLGMYMSSEILQGNKASLELLDEDDEENTYKSVGFRVSIFCLDWLFSNRTPSYTFCAATVL